MTRLPAAPFAVVVVAKSPRSGHVKTRLCPPLSRAQAALLHAAFLRDTVEHLRHLEDVELVVAYTPPEDRGLFEAMCPGTALIPQGDGDLGARLGILFEMLYARGFAAVLAVGADSPTLPLAFVRTACLLLDRSDVDLVIGPADDGGYYLIGLKQMELALFRDIPWSTDRAYTVTMARAAEAGLRPACLPTWYDVDRAADLERLARDLDAGSAPHTRAQLARLGLV